MPNSIFETKKGKRTTRKISVVLPLELSEDITKIKTELAKKDPNLVFNVNKICEEALNTAVKKAVRELAKL